MNAIAFQFRRLVAVMWVMAAVPTTAAAATVSLPAGALIVPVGGATTVEMAIDDATGIEAAEVRIQFDGAVVSVTDVTETPLTGNCVVQSNTAVDNEVLVAIACFEVLSGSGPLATITFEGNSAGSSSLSVERCILNEGAPSCVPVDGEITVTQCALDVDGSGGADVSTDLVYMMRHLMGLTPVPPSFRVLDPGIPPDAAIAATVDAAATVLDVDANGIVDVATDLIYAARHLLGLPPVPASFRVLDPGIPSDSAIAANIDAICP